MNAAFCDKSFFSLLIFFVICTFTISFFRYIANIPQIAIYLSKSFSFFIIKHIHLVSSEYLLYTHFRKEYAYRSNFFIVFVTNEIFRILFSKRKLMKFFYFINIYIVYRNRTYILMKFVFFSFNVIKLYNFYIIFTYGFNFL